MSTSPELEAAFEAAHDTAEDGMVQRLVERLADRFGGVANASAVFGDPVERNGVTIIPVAKVRWGAGAGAGRGGEVVDGKPEGGEGGGGGGGVSVKPIGYIELRDGTAEFIRFRDPGAMLPVLIGGAIAAWIGARAIRAIFR